MILKIKKHQCYDDQTTPTTHHFKTQYSYTTLVDFIEIIYKIVLRQFMEFVLVWFCSPWLIEDTENKPENKLKLVYITAPTVFKQQKIQKIGNKDLKV